MHNTIDGTTLHRCNARAKKFFRKMLGQAPKMTLNGWYGSAYLSQPTLGQAWDKAGTNRSKRARQARTPHRTLRGPGAKEEMSKYELRYDWQWGSRDPQIPNGALSAAQAVSRRGANVSRLRCPAARAFTAFARPVSHSCLSSCKSSPNTRDSSLRAAASAIRSGFTLHMMRDAVCPLCTLVEMDG